MAATSSDGGGKASVTAPAPAIRIVAGGIVFFTLVLFADIPATSQIAVAFAYLILLSAALTVGPVAFARISSLVGG